MVRLRRKIDAHVRRSAPCNSVTRVSVLKLLRELIARFETASNLLISCSRIFQQGFYCGDGLW